MLKLGIFIFQQQFIGMKTQKLSDFSGFSVFVAENTQTKNANDLPMTCQKSQINRLNFAYHRGFESRRPYQNREEVSNNWLFPCFSCYYSKKQTAICSQNGTHVTVWSHLQKQKCQWENANDRLFKKAREGCLVFCFRRCCEVDVDLPECCVVRPAAPLLDLLHRDLQIKT